jgi:hypothetical protein
MQVLTIFLLGWRVWWLMNWCGQRNAEGQARRYGLIQARLLAQPKSGVRGATMFQFLRGIALIGGIMMNCGAAIAASDVTTANGLMPGCRHHLQTDSPPDDGRLMYLVPYCAGIIEGLIYATSAVCLPEGVTHDQGVRVIVKYIDDRPQRLNENFKALAVEALQAAWPCKK